MYISRDVPYINTYIDLASLNASDTTCQDSDSAINHVFCGAGIDLFPMEDMITLVAEYIEYKLSNVNRLYNDWWHALR